MKKSLSLVRRLEYEELSKIELYGRILDLGGSKKSVYFSLIKGDFKVEAVNIDKNCEVDFRFNIENEFPIESGRYDAIICLNVLEHTYNFHNVARESFRILKNNGRLIGAVPFLVNVHNSPSDFFRYTKSALEKIFIQAGFKEVEIKELGSGLFSVLYQLKFGLYKIDFIRKIVLPLHILFDKIIKIIKPNNLSSEKYMPLGYFFIATK
jgi:SAM-dependent methyltransferase